MAAYECGAVFKGVYLPSQKFDCPFMTSSASKAKTGISGLDDVLAGGLSVGHVFLLEGEPGAGKTTTGLQFLLAGADAGERCLYVTLSESERELRAGAASHRWTLGHHI